MSENMSLDLFIKKLFHELAYESTSFSFVDPEDPIINDSLLCKDVFKNNYYLLLFVNNASDLKNILDRQAHYFFLIKEFFNELVEVDKNTSMIIFLRTTGLSNDILFLEEDPYYFKKYVFPYTLEQFNNLLETYSADFDSFGIKNSLDKIVSDVGMFEGFKSNPDELNLFQFVSNLFIKIPILKMPTDVDKDIYLLKDSISNSLKDKELFTVKQQIDFQITSEDTEESDDELNTKIIESLINFYEHKEE